MHYDSGVVTAAYHDVDTELAGVRCVGKPVSQDPEWSQEGFLVNAHALEAARAPWPPPGRSHSGAEHPMSVAVPWLQVLQASLDALPAPLAIIDCRGTVIATNAAWTRAEADNGVWDDTVHAPAPYLEICAGADGPDLAQRSDVAQGLTDVLSGASSSFTLAYSARSSVAERPFRLIISAIPPPLGGAIALHQEVSSSAPNPAPGSEPAAIQVANQAPVLIWVADSDQRCTWFNQVFQEFTGTPLQACDGWSARIHPDDRARCQAQLSQEAGLQRHGTRTYRLRRHDGAYRWIHEHARSVTNADGTYAGFIATCSDVTASKDFENELKHHRDRLDRELHFAGALNRMSQAINGVDERGQLLDLAAAILGRALGLDRSMIFDIRLSKRLALALSEWLNPACPLAVSVKRDFPLELFPESLRHLWEMRSPLESHREQVNARLASEGSATLLHGDMNIHSLLWHPIDFSSDGFSLLVLNQVAHRRHWQPEERRFLESMATLVTVALQKIRIATDHQEDAAQQRHAQQMEAMARVARGAALEDKRLIASLTGHARHLSQALQDDAERHAQVEAMLTLLEQASMANGQLLAFGRAHAQRQDLINGNVLVQRLTTWLTGMSGDGITLATSVAPQPSQLRGDPDALTLALMNIARNAREAMPNGGVLSISTECQTMDDVVARRLGVEAGAYLAIHIGDTGLGMAPDTLARAFEPFFTTKDAVMRPGLGLSCAYGIVSATGGCITIASQPGQGATVTVALPVVEAPQDGTRTPLRLAALSGHETVLVVEDDPAVLALVRDTLRHRGYLVLTASGGQEALKIAEAHHGAIDLLLSDVVLPQISGPALAAQLLQSRKALRVMLMSGYPADAFSANREIANTAFLAKPFTIDELVRTVRSALDPGRPCSA